MSVHGEYGRALETLISRMREVEGDSAPEWSTTLLDARIDRNPDLSTAASKCMVLLDQLDQSLHVTVEHERTGNADYLRGPFDHLRAHCRSLLGIP
jgi:hypothetical protein